jgi:hypothetical protein
VYAAVFLFKFLQNRDAAQTGMAPLFQRNDYRGHQKSANGLFDLHSRATDTIDQRAGVQWYFITAPGDVAVRTHQNEMVPVTLEHLGFAQGHHLEWHLYLACSLGERRGVRRIGSKPEQDEIATVQIES